MMTTRQYFELAFRLGRATREGDPLAFALSRLERRKAPRTTPDRRKKCDSE